MLNYLFPNCIIEDFEAVEDKLILKAHSDTKAAFCPSCNENSSRVHGYYQRYPHDLPLVDYQLQFCLRVKRFYCLNECCDKTTFAESFEPWLARYAHRSKRLIEKQAWVAITLSAKASEELLNKLLIPISHDTALNLVHDLAIPECETPRVLGVDDFAIRKRKSYGTILLDLEKHAVIDVLADRSSATLIKWLEAHQGIEIISRDRSQDYKSACDKGAPDALQVADRWHLLKNLSDILKRWFERHKRYLVEAAAKAESVTIIEGLSDDKLTKSFSSQGTFEKALQAKLNTRRKRQQQFEEAKRLKEGFNMRYIANKLKMGRSTLNRWFAQGGFPNKRRSQVIEPYQDYLQQRFELGITNKMQLYREILSQGFTGSHASVYIFFTELEAGLITMTKAPKRKVKRYTAYEGTRIFTSQKEILSTQDKKRLEQLFQSMKEAKLCYHLVQSFISLFKKQKENADETIQAFRSWLEDAKNSGISEIARFAKGLSNDKAAIEAALTLTWSNGMTEGKITKLKFIKRSMYGRAGFDLLRKKVLLAA